MEFSCGKPWKDLHKIYLTGFLRLSPSPPIIHDRTPRWGEKLEPDPQQYLTVILREFTQVESIAPYIIISMLLLSVSWSAKLVFRLTQVTAISRRDHLPSQSQWRDWSCFILGPSLLHLFLVYISFVSRNDIIQTNVSHSSMCISITA